MNASVEFARGRLPDGDFLPPCELRPSLLPFWSKHFTALTGSAGGKAILLLEHDCVQYVGHDFETGQEGVFICLPLNSLEVYTEPMPGGVRAWQKIALRNEFGDLRDYNSKRTKAYKLYKMKIEEVITWKCQCQGWSTKEKLYFKLKKAGADSGPSGFRLGGINCEHVQALYGWFDMKNWSGLREKIIEERRSNR